jgi:hypothetical protein
MKDSTNRTLMWLDFYGWVREAGFSKYGAQEFMDGGSDYITGAMAEMTAAESEGRLAARSIGRTVGDGVAAVGAGIIAVVGGTGIGAIVGAVVAAVGLVISGLTELFTVDCDEWDCPSPKSYHRRTLVGINTPDPGWPVGIYVNDDGSCTYFHRRCAMVRYMHDGMLIKGIAVRKPETPDGQGRIRGVNGLASGGSSKLNEHWRKREATKPNIRKGDQRRPWETPETWYGRAWRVGTILNWMQSKIACRQLSCMQEVLLGTKGTMGESAFNTKRRRGSRWYSSLVHMMTDVWEVGQAIGPTRFAEVLRSEGCNTAGTEMLAMANRKEYQPNELPFPYWPVLKHCSFDQLRRTLVKMKPMIPYEGPATGAMPEGEKVRTVQMAQLMPMAVRGPAIFDPALKMPVPIKTGSRLPRWWVWVLGATGAGVAGVAIYKGVKDRGEE